MVDLKRQSGDKKRGSYMATATRRTTTKDVSLLLQLEESGQLTLAPEFQRNSVWPRPAKAFLIDTILSGRPIPPLFFLRATSAQTGRNQYQVVDGQQRLRAVFEFEAGRFSLTESEGREWAGLRWKNLTEEQRNQILNYDFIVEELSGYSNADIRDMFARMNRYVVPLNAQERRRAQFESAFIKFAEALGAWPFWTDQRIFSAAAVNRHRTDEFVEELCILLLEGPQDKKSSIELYVTRYADEFEFEDELRDRLKQYFSLISQALPDLRSMQLRRPVNLYSLVGALDRSIGEQGSIDKVSVDRLGMVLAGFDRDISSEKPSDAASRYLRAASRQTDNIGPRETRISILERLVQSAM